MPSPNYKQCLKCGFWYDEDIWCGYVNGEFPHNCTMDDETKEKLDAILEKLDAILEKL